MSIWNQKTIEELYALRTLMIGTVNRSKGFTGIVATREKLAKLNTYIMLREMAVA